MKEKFIYAHMECAFVYSKLSYCVRKKVGCVVVKDGRIISIGYNGAPAGFPNICETEDGSATLPTTIHAERNAITKLARCHESAEGASIFITVAPCIECAIEILQSGIKEVYYAEDYHSTDGIDFLRSAGISVQKVS